ncbi:uncharacterized protein [Polyergus mexicanus]|uniref:uncharacterized protein n=1 Tax=Polyergus mexicanus TaxID=615972 RepID=UPI0038B532E8
MRNERNCATRRRRRGSPAMRRDEGYSMAGGVVPGTNRIFFGPREMIGSQGETNFKSDEGNDCIHSQSARHMGDKIQVVLNLRSANYQSATLYIEPHIASCAESQSHSSYDPVRWWRVKIRKTTNGERAESTKRGRVHVTRGVSRCQNRTNLYPHELIFPDDSEFLSFEI